MKIIDHPHFLLLLLLAACLCSCQEKLVRPNIVLIIADDMNWDDSGTFGHPYTKTPHIDQIAQEGKKFTRAFLTTSSCSPRRASIITGKYPHNTDVEQVHWPFHKNSKLLFSNYCRRIQRNDLSKHASRERSWKFEYCTINLFRNPETNGRVVSYRDRP